MTADAVQIAIAHYTLALVVVGALQVIGLLVQAYFLCRALRATEKAATATTDSVKLALEGMRAQVIVNVRNPILGFNVGQKPSFVVDLRNVASTAAYHVSYETWIEVVKAPFFDFTSAADYFKIPNTIAIHPNDQIPITVQIELQHPLSVTEAVGIAQNNTDLLCYRIHLTWDDAFGKPHWADFAHGFNGQGIGPLPKYNDAG